MLEDHMSEWLKECYTDEYDHEYIDNLSDERSFKAINREYDGGVEQFIKDQLMA